MQTTLHIINESMITEGQELGGTPSPFILLWSPTMCAATLGACSSTALIESQVAFLFKGRKQHHEVLMEELRPGKKLKDLKI